MESIGHKDRTQGQGPRQGQDARLGSLSRLGHKVRQQAKDRTQGQDDSQGCQPRIGHKVREHAKDGMQGQETRQGQDARLGNTSRTGCKVRKPFQVKKNRQGVGSRSKKQEVCDEEGCLGRQLLSGRFFRVLFSGRVTP